MGLYSITIWNRVFSIVIPAKPVKTDDNANVTTDQKTSFNEYDDDSEFSSELEEVYEQFSKWLEDPIIKENVEKLDPRDEAVLSFASSLLKRTLSESFVGVPLTDGCISSTCKQLKWKMKNEMSARIYCYVAYSLRTGIPAEENSMQSYQDKQKNRQIINARSLSLEVTKHKHRLAAQLVRETACFFINHRICTKFRNSGKQRNRLQVMRKLQAHLKGILFC